MKNFSHITGNRTRYLPAGSAMPQPTLPPRTGETTLIIFQLKFFNQRCQPSEVLELNTNHYDRYGRVM